MTRMLGQAVEGVLESVEGGCELQQLNQSSDTSDYSETCQKLFSVESQL